MRTRLQEQNKVIEYLKKDIEQAQELKTKILQGVQGIQIFKVKLYLYFYINILVIIPVS